MPLLSSGQLIACHANNEKHAKNFVHWNSTATKLDENNFEISGRKEWITNAKNANLFAVSVRIEDGDSPMKTGVVLVPVGCEGLETLTDHERSGLKGVSLATV